MSAWTLPAAMGGVLLLGLAVSRRASRVLAWTLVAASAVVAERITAAGPAGLRMLALISLVLLALKAVVSVENPSRLDPLRWLAFAAAWPGMRPAVFATLGGPRLPGAGRLVAQGFARLALGLALIASARLLWTATGSRLAATIPLLAGLSLALHFGLFNLLAGAWRALGADTSPLFRAPLLSRSLGEFWSRRWNIAFSEMTAAALYRPLSARLGRPAALVAAFAFSGILHELAISVPVGAGYGLPLAYFALHGVLMLVERRLPAPPGRFWTIFWLATPLPILFHPSFLDGIVWPLLGMQRV